MDFAPDMALATRLPNTIQLRTLSKAYGLAGLRLGYAIAAPDWVLKADEIRIQFAGSNLSAALIHKVHPNPSPESQNPELIREVPTPASSRGHLPTRCSTTTQPRG